MLRSVVLHKHLGETPLEAIEQWKREHPRYAEVPAAYAGRLDPMAEGKLLILLGDECKRQDLYRGLDKEYEIEVMLGIGSDTGDVLGIPSASQTLTEITPSAVRRALRAVRGTHLLPYPVFSSKTVNGKPLFLHALEGTLGEIEIPTHLETVYSIKIRSRVQISPDALRTRIEDTLSHAPTTSEPSKVLGADFRIQQVRAGWEKVFQHVTEPVPVLSLRVTTGSGAYMRTLAQRLGRELGTLGLALSIKRTRIGRYIPLPFGYGVWVRSY